MYSPVVNEHIPGMDVQVVNIIIADPDPLVRRGVQTLLQDEVKARVVGDAADMDAVWGLFEQYPVDTLLIGFSLLAEDDFRPLSNMKREYPGCQIIVMGTDIKSEAILKTLRLGASGYLPKRGCIEDFRVALGQVLVGMSPLLPDVAQQLLSHVIMADSPIEDDGRKETLSTRENEVLRCLMKGMSNKEIATCLQVKNRTVKAHVSNILRKMQVADRTQAVLKALQSTASTRI